MKKTISLFTIILFALVLINCSSQQEKSQSFKVTFIYNNGVENKIETVLSGDLIAKPKDPSKTNHTFLNWYINDSLTTVYDFNSKVTKDITLYAKWNIDFDTINDKIISNYIQSCVMIQVQESKGIGFDKEIRKASGVVFYKKDNLYYILTSYKVAKANYSVPPYYENFNIFIFDSFNTIHFSEDVKKFVDDEGYGLSVIVLDTSTYATPTKLKIIEIAEIDPIKNDNVFVMSSYHIQANTVAKGLISQITTSSAIYTFPVITLNIPLKNATIGGALLNVNCKLIGLLYDQTTNGDSLAIPIKKINEFLEFKFWPLINK